MVDIFLVFKQIQAPVGILRQRQKDFTTTCLLKLMLMAINNGIKFLELMKMNFLLVFKKHQTEDLFWQVIHLVTRMVIKQKTVAEDLIYGFYGLMQMAIKYGMLHSEAMRMKTRNGWFKHQMEV